MEGEAINEVIHIAALGTEYTFKAVGASSKVLIELIKTIAKKQKLNKSEQNLVKLAAEHPVSMLKLKESDLTEFRSLAKSHAVQFAVAKISDKYKSGDNVNVVVRYDQLSLVNSVLEHMGYAQIQGADKELTVDTGKKESPSRAELNRQIGDSASVTGKEAEIPEKENSFLSAAFRSGKAKAPTEISAVKEPNKNMVVESRGFVDGLIFNAKERAESAARAKQKQRAPRAKAKATVEIPEVKIK